MAHNHTDQEYLAALAVLEDQLGLPPTLIELATALHMSSKSAVRARLVGMEARGDVERRTEAWSSRNWRITRKGRKAIKALT